MLLRPGVSSTSRHWGWGSVHVGWMGGCGDSVWRYERRMRLDLAVGRKLGFELS